MMIAPIIATQPSRSSLLRSPATNSARAKAPRNSIQIIYGDAVSELRGPIDGPLSGEGCTNTGLAKAPSASWATTTFWNTGRTDRLRTTIEPSKRRISRNQDWAVERTA